jgi:hypothetical protein
MKGLLRFDTVLAICALPDGEQHLELQVTNEGAGPAIDSFGVQASSLALGVGIPVSVPACKERRAIAAQL